MPRPLARHHGLSRRKWRPRIDHRLQFLPVLLDPGQKRGNSNLLVSFADVSQVMRLTGRLRFVVCFSLGFANSCLRSVWRRLCFIARSPPGAIMPFVEARMMVQISPHVHADFLSLRDLVEKFARRAFRRCLRENQDEFVAEAVAAAFQSFVSLKRRGKLPHRFSRQLAIFAVQHVKSDRRVGGQIRSRDIMAWKSYWKRGIQKHSLSSPSLPWNEILADDQAPIPDQVIMRTDWPAFVGGLPRREQQMVWMLAEGFSATEVSEKLGISAGRVTQLRKQWLEGWKRFQGTTTI